MNINESTVKNTPDTVVGTINSNKLLIGSIAAGCGVAIFLLTTETGKRLRNEIQDKTLDLYDYVSDQVTSGWERAQEIAQNLLSREDVQKVSRNIRRVA